MALRFVSWNLNNFARLSGQVDLLAATGADLIALQEVTPRSFAAIREGLSYDWAVCSLALKDGHATNPKPSLCTAVLGRAPFALRHAELLLAAPLPERFLIATVGCGAMTLAACSFHIPPGSNWKVVKSASFRAAAQWAASQSVPTVIGLDANAPKLDHPVHKLNQWWRADEDRFLGAQSQHGLQDAFRRYLDGHPGGVRRDLGAVSSRAARVLL